MSNLSKRFTEKNRWVKTDGWRGYYEPLYAVAGANDTGNWNDSPCPSDIATKDLNMVKRILSVNDIPHREIPCETSNVFCVHRYIIVPPFFYSKALSLVDDFKKSESWKHTTLLYAVTPPKKEES